MKLLRGLWKLSVMAGVFGVGYIVGREHSFEEEEQWNEENEENEEDNGEKGDSQDVSEQPDKEAAAPKSECTGCAEETEVVFSYESESAAKVSVVGDFNNWNKDATPLTREGSVWSAKVKLSKGKHEYQFVINDTDWVTDPKATETAKNKYEGKNSVLTA